MSLPVVLRHEAEVEFDEAFDYYDQRRPGLGTIFAQRIQKVFDSIATDPQRHAVVLADARKIVVKQFPYCVYYRAETTRVEVLAVFHTSRDPLICQGRV